MNTKPSLQLGLLVCFITGTLLAQDDPPEMASLRDHGLPGGALQEVMPANALIHLEFKDPLKALGELQKFVVQTVPEKAAPPPMQEMFNSPNPLLTALGMQLLKTPISAEALSQKLGLNASQPVSLTLYPGDPRRSFVASIPVANHGPLSGFLQFALHPEAMQEISMNGRSMVRFKLSNPNLPQLYAACSADRVYFSAEPSVLLHLYDKKSYPRMAEDAHFKSTRDLAGGYDLFLTVNPSIVKPVLPQLEFYKFLPASYLAEGRQQLLQGIGEQQRQIIDQRLRMQLKVESLEQLLDYVEIFITATYEELFDFVVSQLDAFNGVTLAYKLDHDFPQASFFLHMKSIEPGECVNPIDQASVLQALSAIPGKYDHFSVKGRTPAHTVSPLLESWLGRIRSRLESQNLNDKPLEVLETLIRETVKPIDPTSQSDWTLNSLTRINPPPSMEDYQTLESYFQGLSSSTGPAYRNVTIAPGQSPELLERVIASRIEAIQSNRELWQKTLQPDNKYVPFFIRDFRLETAERENGLKRFTYENVFLTRGGFFGFNEHELINRKMYYARNVGDYLVYHQASGKPDWIQSLRPNRESAVNPALQKLIERIPDGAVCFRIDQNLRSLPQFMEGLRDFESLLHRDVAQYLSQAREIVSDDQSPEAVKGELAGLKFSPLVYSVNHDPETGEVYCLLPGGIVFPRPKVTDTLSEFMQPFGEKADELGGLACYVRVVPGTLEFSAIQSTEALSYFVKTVGNAVAENFLWTPEKRQLMMSSVVAARDFDPNRYDQILLKNPQWEYLPMGPNSGPWPGQSAPREQKPYEIQTPIAERPEGVSGKLIDLSDHYNANVNDTWHQGGLEGNHLRRLDQGIQSMAGVKFDVRGLIQLNGQGARGALAVFFPESVEGVSIDQSCRKIHVLHGTGWPEENGTKIGAYRLHYADGETRELPIVYGEHVRDWWVLQANPELPKAEVAWEGGNEAAGTDGAPLKLYKAAYDNPRPDVKVTSMDFVSLNTGSAPFLIAVTVE